MEQIVVLLFVAVFGDGEISSHSTIFEDAEDRTAMELCERNELKLWNVAPEVYVESDVISMFSECITLVTAEVPK